VNPTTRKVINCSFQLPKRKLLHRKSRPVTEGLRKWRRSSVSVDYRTSNGSLTGVLRIEEPSYPNSRKHLSHDLNNGNIERAQAKLSDIKKTNEWQSRGERRSTSDVRRRKPEGFFKSAERRGSPGARRRGRRSSVRVAGTRARAPCVGDR
jgi:hypothetical protein